MLRMLVRVAVFSVTIFLSLLAGLFLVAEEESFPQGTNYSMSADFSDSALSQTEILFRLDEFATIHDVFLAKVIADPEDFYHGKSLIQFGSQAPTQSTALDWFTPGMHGELQSSAAFGVASLNGVYAVSGSDVELQAFENVLQDAGADFSTNQRSALGVLGFALFNMEAWLALATSLLLLLSLGSTWYVLRMRARSLKILNGAKTGSIITEDMTSLLRVSALPAGVAVVVAAAIVAIQGNASFLGRFLLVDLVMVGIAAVLLTCSGVVIGVMTWPSVDSISSRRPPERHFTGISEGLKIISVILVGLTVPVVAASATAAVASAFLSAEWGKLNDQVRPRLLIDQSMFDSQTKQIAELARSADQAETVMFSYAFELANIIGVNTQPAVMEADGLVLVNQSYLETMMQQPLSKMQQSGSLKKVNLEDIDPAITEFLEASTPLWVADNAGFNIDTDVQLFQYVGQPLFPAQLPNTGEMRGYQSPVIALIEHPGTLFDDQFLAATVTSGNISFDGHWFTRHLEQSPLAELVLSTDRISDAGLMAAQTQRQTANLQSFSLALEVLALLMTLAVSAWIYGISRMRRVFVERTSGLTWGRILRRRMAWEGVIAVLILVAASLGAGQLSLLSLSAAIIYFLVSSLVHTGAIRGVFNSARWRRA